MAPADDTLESDFEPAVARSLFEIASRRILKLTTLIALAAIAAGWLGLDVLVYRQISERLSTPDPIDHSFYNSTRNFWETVREFGSVRGAVVAFAALLLVHSRGWRVALSALLAVTPTDFAGFLLQGLIGRLRPNHSVVEGASGWFAHLQFLPPPQGLIGNTATCFPSGEATAAFALATALAACWPRAKFVWYTLASLVSIERVIHGSHFLSDVVAGALLGFSMTSLLLPRCERIVTVVASRHAPTAPSSRNK